MEKEPVKKKSEISKNKYVAEWLEEADDMIVFDGDPYGYFIFGSQCEECQHLLCGDHLCEAFPDGIPPEIWLGKHNHRTPYSGDHGLTFLPKEKE